MKLKHLAYHGGRKGTGSLGDNGLSNPIQQENVRLAITKALRLNYSISRRLKKSRCLKKSRSLLRKGPGFWDSGFGLLRLLHPCDLFLTHHSFGMVTLASMYVLSFSLQEIDLHFP